MPIDPTWDAWDNDEQIKHFCECIPENISHIPQDRMEPYVKHLKQILYDLTVMNTGMKLKVV